MGIEVTKKIVTVTGNHERLVVTSTLRNPTTSLLPNGMEVHSIFQRTRVGDKENDGNPLIYALKRRFGFSIPVSSIKTLRKDGETILKSILQNKVYDFIVPIPSSSPISRMLCRRIVKLQGRHTRSLPCLKKATIRDVLASLPEPAMVPARHRRDFVSQLNMWQRTSPGALVEMKVVGHTIRKYVSPFVADPNLLLRCSQGAVLLVDDLCSSGTSLEAAEKLIAQHRPRVLRAVCLLSQIA